MEGFILFVVVLAIGALLGQFIAVIWLCIRQRRFSVLQERFDELSKHVDRLEDRLTRTEKSAATPLVTVPEVRPVAPASAPAPAPTPTPVPHIPTPVAQTPPTPIPPPPPPQTPQASAALKTLGYPGFVQPATAIPPPSAAVPPPPPPPSIAKPQATPKPSLSLEERLGRNWLNKLGIVTLVIGLALFLGYQLRTLGPKGKSSIGLILSLGMLAAGVLLERRERYRIFARAAIGGGWALTFFVTYALYHVTAMKVINSQALDLTLMLAVAAAMVAHSLKYKSQVITSLAFLLAFVTVGISDVTLFSLVAGALLAAGLVFVAANQSWFELGLCGLIGVYLNHFLWLHRVLPDGGQPGHPFPEFFASAGLLLFYWLLFRLFYILRVPTQDRQRFVSHLTAVLNSVAILSLLKYQSSHPQWAFYGLLVLGSAELALAFAARRRFHDAFIVLSTIASVLIVAAIPFRFNGAHLTLLWLFEAEVLLLAGIRLRETVFRRLGSLAALVAAAQILVVSIPPIIELRQSQLDPSRHWPVAVALLSATLLFWFNSEIAPRHWSVLREDEFDAHTLVVFSYIAAFFAACGLWVLIPGAWTIVAWLVLMLMLAWLADKFNLMHLSLQADALAVASLVRIAAINFQLPDTGHIVSSRSISISLAAALLYLGMGRRTRPLGITANYVAPAYSWAAAGLLSVLVWYELEPVSVAVAWTVFALILELGLNFSRSYLRQQAAVLLTAGFIRIFFSNLVITTAAGSWLNARVYTVLPLIAAYFWVYQRLYSASAAEPTTHKFDRFISQIAAWFGVVATAALFYFQFRTEWVVISWACLAVALLAAGWSLKRTIFLEQGLVALVIVLQRAIFTLLEPPALVSTFATSRTFTIGLTCGLLFAALPIAFAVRRQYPSPPEKPAWRLFTLYRPEQSFFFVPLVILIVLLAIELSAGMITIGWIALGVLTFLFALTVGQRSYRLAGLSLLLLGVAKIICVDIWHAAPRDRYITLIVMGAALLLVSFLYSRYRETIVKYL